MSTVNKISENFQVYVYYEDDASAGVQLPADAQVATDNHNFVGWIDHRDIEKGMCIVMTIAGAQAHSLCRIISNTSSIGAGTDHAVTETTITTPGGVNAALETAMMAWAQLKQVRVLRPWTVARAGMPAILAAMLPSRLAVERWVWMTWVRSRRSHRSRRERVMGSHLPRERGVRT